MQSYVKIEFNTDNAAFDDFESEVSRILKELADRVQYGSRGEYVPIRDANGNSIGSFNHFDSEAHNGQ